MSVNEMYWSQVTILQSWVVRAEGVDLGPTTKHIKNYDMGTVQNLEYIFQATIIDLQWGND